MIHGYRTSFPIPLGEAASWDLEAIERSARVAGTEAAAAGLHWTFAPMVDVTRDARWGRLMEGAGEDPTLDPADKDTPLGNWRGRAEEGSAVSLLEGIQAAVSPSTRVVHAEGAKLAIGPRNFFAPSQYNSTDRSGFPAAVAAARDADVVVVAIGEDAFQSGEGRSQVEVGLKGLQEELLRAVLEVNPKVVVVLMNGRPLVLDWTAEHVPALVEAWHLGSEAGHAASATRPSATPSRSSTGPS